MGSALAGTVALEEANRIRKSIPTAIDVAKNQAKYGKKMNWWERLKFANKVTLNSLYGTGWAENKQAEIEAWKTRQNQRALESDLMNIAQNKTTAQQQLINEQLAENLKNINVQAAGTGMYRSGARLEDIGKAQVNATRAVAQVASQNAMEAKLAAIGQGNATRDYNLKLSQLEAAKNAGDTEAMGGIAEELASSGFFDKLLGLGKEQTGTSANPEEIAGGVYPAFNPLSEEISSGAGQASIFGNFYRRLPRSGVTDATEIPSMNDNPDFYGYAQDVNFDSLLETMFQ